jgi:hypothetical protein
VRPRIAILAAMLLFAGTTASAVVAGPNSKGPVMANAGMAIASLSCPHQLVNLVNSLSEIDGQMDIGLTFAQYKSHLATTHVAYARVAWNSMPYTCLTSAGVPAERAMNEYTAAYNSWAQCVQKVVSGVLANCSSGPGYLFRERQWRLAHSNVQRAVNALG